jgi:four helix bundle protein
MKNFKQLLIWQKGMEIWKETYALTSTLPPEEKFGLVSQMNRCAISIPANIAEGSSRNSQKDYSRFIQIALGSAFELETFLIGVQELDLINSEKTRLVLNMIKEEQKMLISFQSKLEAKS